MIGFQRRGTNENFEAPSDDYNFKNKNYKGDIFFVHLSSYLSVRVGWRFSQSLLTLLFFPPPYFSLLLSSSTLYFFFLNLLFFHRSISFSANNKMKTDGSNNKLWSAFDCWTITRSRKGKFKQLRKPLELLFVFTGDPSNFGHWWTHRISKIKYCKRPVLP